VQRIFEVKHENLHAAALNTSRDLELITIISVVFSLVISKLLLSFV